MGPSGPHTCIGYLQICDSSSELQLPSLAHPSLAMQSRLEEIAKLDDELRTLRERIQYLLTYRNSIVPINRLATETFTQIFRFCMPTSISECRDTEEDGAVQFGEWMHVTHVCQRWRSIAFESKALWTTIPTHDADYAELALKLSDPLPISILDTINNNGIGGGDESDEAEEPCCALYPDMLKRAERVEIRSSDGRYNLIRAVEEDHPVHELILESVEDPIPQFPASLKSLTLLKCPMDWYLPDLNHLTELHISARYQDQVDLSWFVEHLVHVPSLSLLEVVNLFENGSDEIIFRPNLQHIVIEDDIPVVSWFLSSIDLKPDFTLLATLSENRHETEAQDLIQSINHHLQASQYVIRRAILSCGNAIIPFYGQRRGFSFQCSDQDLDSPFLHINADVDSEKWKAWLKLILEFPMDQLQYLSVKGFNSATEWRSWPFRDFKHLRELSIHDTESFAGLVECLVHDTFSAAGSSNWASVLFPALKELTLWDVKSTHQEKVQLADVLRIRGNHGYGLDKLTFVGGSIRAEPDGTGSMVSLVAKLVVKPAEVQRTAKYDWRRKF